ncbi:hypothetical protein [Thermogemmatispora sp.]|uniref:hypothetical protein n=1 Tax=Thermogemmatispora sp. TaxID=1968838 RepID=UPI001D8FBE34|nr:hypothetical protein [Thermogemmatispora sp.]MBX5448793.1 hypothetical protein [Thermogemmatispora sp.]
MRLCSRRLLQALLSEAAPGSLAIVLPALSLGAASIGPPRLLLQALLPSAALL